MVKCLTWAAIFHKYLPLKIIEIMMGSIIKKVKLDMKHSIYLILDFTCCFAKKFRFLLVFDKSQSVLLYNLMRCYL